MPSSHRAALLRRCLIVLLAATAVSGVGCTNAFIAHRDFQMTEPADGVEKVVIRSHNGRVDLASATVDSVRIDGTKFARGSTIEEAEYNVDALEIRTRRLAGDEATLVIELEFPESMRFYSPGASLTVRVPRPCAAEVETGNGTIEVAAMKGPLNLHTSNGRITLRDIEGDVDARTSNGRVEAAGIGGSCRARTSNGSIVLRSIKGDCELDTSNGRIDLIDCTGSVRADSSNGSMVVDATPPDAGSVVLRTSNGRIDLTLPRTMNADLRLTTSNGRVRGSLEQVPIRLRVMDEHRLEATMNEGGGGQVYATTSNGSIAMSFR
ncbi:hypothetical protein RAS1_37510 [Phycisphaerae bacterium RAS1]|nr:hypothetical protein RAS1_37510 [Phycisphaerae bacterium RAS1]